MPRDVIRRLLGHTTSAMVDRVYGKPRPEAIGLLAEKALSGGSLSDPLQFRTSEPPERYCSPGKAESSCGASFRTRTGDLRFTKPLLCRLS